MKQVEIHLGGHACDLACAGVLPEAPSHPRSFRRDFGGKVFTPDDLEIIQSAASNLTRMLSELRQALVGFQSPLSGDQRGKDLAEVVVGEIPDSGDFAGTLLKAQEVDSKYDRAYKNGMSEVGNALALVEARVVGAADGKADRGSP